MIWRIPPLMICLAGLLGASEPVVPSDAQAVEIRRMLRVTGMNRLMDQMITQVIDGSRERHPELSPEFWEKFRRNINANDLIGKLVPLYAKHFTAEELRAINDFYETRIGQQLLAKMPVLMSECMAVGEQWGREVGEKVVMEIEGEKRARLERTGAAKDKL